MGKRRKNGEGTWGSKSIKGTMYQYYRDIDGKYTYGKTVSEVKEKLAKKQELEDVISPNVTSVFTFGDYATHWLYTKRDDITPNTYDNYETAIEKRIKNTSLGFMQLHAVSADLITDFFKDMGQKYSKATIDKTWTVIRQVLKYGMDDDKIPQFNIEKIKLPTEKDVANKKKEIHFITESDMDALYDEANCGNYGNGAKLLIFIMYSGLRLSEARSLTWKNVNSDMTEIKVRTSTSSMVERDSNFQPLKNEDGTLKHKTIQKETKTVSGERDIPLPERAVEVLKYFKDNYNHGDDDFVFVTSNGTQFNSRNVERLLHSILNNSKCECKDYSPHSLRHGYGSLLLAKGIDIKIVSKLLGHSKVETTYNIYIHVLKDDIKNAVRSVFT